MSVKDKFNMYFSREEFACKCGCGFDTADYNLVSVLTILRTEFNKPVFINSGCRCEEHNKKVGGANNSTHKEGKGADIRVEGKTSLEVYNFLNKRFSKYLGLGLYDRWVHIDVRSNHSRWDDSTIYKNDLIL